MYKVMICDDEPALCQVLRDHLTQFAAESGEEFAVDECHSAEELLFRLTPDTDLLLLDIKMKRISGMDAARALREQGHNLCIVFITSLVQYALEGYRVHAFGFLKKPVRYAQFRLQMQDVLQMLRARRPDRITLRVNGQTRSVDVGDIQYLEVQGHALRLVLTTESVACSGTLNELERMLEGKAFFRCHKSYLLNLRHLAKVTQDAAILIGGGQVPVSRHRRRELLDALAQYLGSTN